MNSLPERQLHVHRMHARYLPPIIAQSGECHMGSEWPLVDLTKGAEKVLAHEEKLVRGGTLRPEKFRPFRRWSISHMFENEVKTADGTKCLTQGFGGGLDVLLAPRRYECEMNVVNGNEANRTVSERKRDACELPRDLGDNLDADEKACRGPSACGDHRRLRVSQFRCGR